MRSSSICRKGEPNDREMRCRDGSKTRAQRSVEMPMSATVPDPVALLTGRGHMENSGACAVSTDTEVELRREGE